MKDGPSRYFDLIAADKDIVKYILLLTGSIQGTKKQVCVIDQEIINENSYALCTCVIKIVRAALLWFILFVKI